MEGTMTNPFSVLFDKLSEIERKIEKLDNPKSPSLESLQNENEVFGFQEACSFLKMSKNYVYHLTAGRQIPHFKRGRKLYFKKSDLTAWLLENQVKTVKELN